MKTFVITLSSVFPTTHPRKGKGTAFAPAFRNGQTCRKCKEKNPALCYGDCFSIRKIHTIRANYTLWEKRIAQIQNGEAVLSVRQWTGKPYRSKQVEIARLSAEDGVSDITKLLLTNIRIDLKSEYPDLRPEFVDFLVAVYQCEITLLSLFRYTEKQTEKVERLVGHKIGKILPSELRRLSILVPQFVGDKPISDRFRKQKQTYVETFATQMALIELDGTALDDGEEDSL